MGQSWAQISQRGHHSWEHLASLNLESESRSVVSDSLQPHTVHGILQARILEWVALPFSRGIFLTHGSNPGLPHCRRIIYQLSHKESPRILEQVAYPFSSGSSQPTNRTGVSCGFFTNRTIREALGFLITTHKLFQLNT